MSASVARPSRRSATGSTRERRRSTHAANWCCPAAAVGGTTTVISFAAQHVGMSLKTVVDEYHQYAERGAVVDYAFHMILADPREIGRAKEVPPLVKAGHASPEGVMTYD